MARSFDPKQLWTSEAFDLKELYSDLDVAIKSLPVDEKSTAEDDYEDDPAKVNCMKQPATRLKRKLDTIYVMAKDCENDQACLTDVAEKARSAFSATHRMLKEQNCTDGNVTPVVMQGYILSHDAKDSQMMEAVTAFSQFDEVEIRLEYFIILIHSGFSKETVKAPKDSCHYRSINKLTRDIQDIIERAKDCKKAKAGAKNANDSNVSHCDIDAVEDLRQSFADVEEYWNEIGCASSKYDDMLQLAIWQLSLDRKHYPKLMKRITERGLVSGSPEFNMYYKKLVNVIESDKRETNAYINNCNRKYAIEWRNYLEKSRDRDTLEACLTEESESCVHDVAGRFLRSIRRIGDKIARCKFSRLDLIYRNFYVELLFSTKSLTKNFRLLVEATKEANGNKIGVEEKNINIQSRGSSSDRIVEGYSIQITDRRMGISKASPRQQKKGNGTKKGHTMHEYIDQNEMDNSHKIKGSDDRIDTNDDHSQKQSNANGRRGKTRAKNSRRIGTEDDDVDSGRRSTRGNNRRRDERIDEQREDVLKSRRSGQKNDDRMNEDINGRRERKGRDRSSQKSNDN